MVRIRHKAFEKAAEKLGGEKHFHFSVPLTTGEETVFYVVKNSQNQVAILLDTFEPIVFETPQGRQFTWLDRWGHYYGKNLLIIDDGQTESLGIYGYDGKPQVLEYTSALNTPEVFYRIQRRVLTQIDGYPFFLRPFLLTLLAYPSVSCDEFHWQK